ncbi:MAG: peptidyl-prolyl cis-trans isomerase [Bradymonadales bacterium]|nr:MAG: peptidyl-prolyl cis-trans isomerase [Bradymonadales bacterium]
MVELVTSKGRIVIQLKPEQAPKTVENFLRYVEDGFYDGLIFHRVIDGFMIQGGGFDVQMQQKPVRAPIENESKSGLANKAMSLSMARTADPHSATAQFFINLVDNPYLDAQGDQWGYAVFAEVVEGEEVVREIARVETGSLGFHENVPLESVIIQSAKRLKVN